MLGHKKDILKGREGGKEGREEGEEVREGGKEGKEGRSSHRYCIMEKQERAAREA